MKVKTSVTLSATLLKAIDEVAGPDCNRSAVIEEAATEWVRRRQRVEAERHDAAIFARLTPKQVTDSEILDYSIDPMELGDDVEVSDEVLARWAREDAARGTG